MMKAASAMAAFLLFWPAAAQPQGEVYQYLNSADQAIADLHACHDNLENSVPIAIRLGPTSKIRAPLPVIENAVRQCREDRGKVMNYNPALYRQLKSCWDALEEAEADILGGGTHPFLPTLAPGPLGRAEGCIGNAQIALGGDGQHGAGTPRNYFDISIAAISYIDMRQNPFGNSNWRPLLFGQTGWVVKTYMRLVATRNPETAARSKRSTGARADPELPCN